MIDRKESTLLKKKSNTNLMAIGSNEEQFLVMSNVKRFSTFCHAILFSLFGGAYLYNIWFNVIHKRLILLDYLYLTHWNITFQVFFSMLELISDIFPSLAELTITFRGKFLYSIVFPFSFFVCIFFWILAIYDENLVREPPEERSEEWYNQLVHTFILPAALIECLLVEHKLPNLFESTMITVIVAITYMLWMTFFGVVFNKWTYKLFGESSSLKFAFYFVIYLMALIIGHRIGIWIHKKYWTTSTADINNGNNNNKNK